MNNEHVERETGREIERQRVTEKNREKERMGERNSEKIEIE